MSKEKKKLINLYVRIAVGIIESHGYPIDKIIDAVGKAKYEINYYIRTIYGLNKNTKNKITPFMELGIITGIIVLCLLIPISIKLRILIGLLSSCVIDGLILDGRLIMKDILVNWKFRNKIKVLCDLKPNDFDVIGIWEDSVEDVFYVDNISKCDGNAVPYISDRNFLYLCILWYLDNKRNNMKIVSNNIVSFIMGKYGDDTINNSKSFFV